MAATRQPHAALDQAGRRSKAEKIRSLLQRPSTPLRVLEVGTGSGAIAHYFATHSELSCDVDAVDVVDIRQIREGYRFALVPDTALPFERGTFDIVISNHVIEHVGAEVEQQRHLAEIARVLRPDGRAYLASPNRWQVVEPHFHLAFLSWLPKPWRSPYVRWRQRGPLYDCEPLNQHDLERLLTQAGFDYMNACVPAIRLTSAQESNPSPSLRLAATLPDWLLERMQPICPTHVYLLRLARDAVAGR